MKNLSKQIQKHFDDMCLSGKLFRSSIDGTTIWELYLSSFKPEDDPVFRDPASSVHNCNLCNNFIRRYGNIVAINENLEIITLFDIIPEDEEYRASFKVLSEKIKNSPVKEVFFETFDELNSLPYEKCKKTQDIFRLGIAQNTKMYTKDEALKFGVVKPDEIRTFNHFHLDIDKMFVDNSGKSVASIMSDYRESKEVFMRAMEEIPLSVLETVSDLILQDSILNGKSYLEKLEKIIDFKRVYDTIDSSKKDNWCWVMSYRFPYAKFKNELIGVLCTELAEGKPLNEACLSWNKRADPVNYMKAKAPITPAQIESARKFVEENNYEASFYRRCATIDDIKASEILHMAGGDSKIKEISIFDKVKPTAPTSGLKKSDFDKVQEVSIEEFMNDILPTCESVEALLVGSQSGNLVTMLTTDKVGSKPIFKWDNNYSWTYKGGLAGKSLVKENVKKVGGNVEGYLRFSIMWNEDGKDIVDFDAHAIQPDRQEIYYANYKGTKTTMSGSLDIDMINPSEIGVENIFWTDKNKLADGKYRFFIHNFNGHPNKGIKAEIEIAGKSYSYDIKNQVMGTCDIATITLKGGELVDIVHNITPLNVDDFAQEVYGLETNKFHKVNLVCLSPNFWGTNKVGNKHYFFMLDKAKSPDPLRGFHNEFLCADLLTHRKVMDTLGEVSKAESTENQLSGLGFNSTVRDELIVRLTIDNNKKVIKIKF